MSFDGFLFGMMALAVVLRLGLYLALEAKVGGPSFLEVFFDTRAPVHPLVRRVMLVYTVVMCGIGVWFFA